MNSKRLNRAIKNNKKGTSALANERGSFFVRVCSYVFEVWNINRLSRSVIGGYF